MPSGRALTSCEDIPVSYHGAEYSSFVSGYRFEQYRKFPEIRCLWGLTVARALMFVMA